MKRKDTKYQGRRVATVPSTDRVRHKPTRRKKKGVRPAIKAIALIMAFGLVAFGATGYYLKNRFEGNIATQTFIPESVTGISRPTVLPEVKGALNILIMGSDTRDGANGVGIGGETPGLSDTTLFLHLAEDRSFAYGVSIPRDAMVERPPCPLKTDPDTIDPGGLTQFNAAFAVGGPACTVATVEQLTGVRVDHFAVIDFQGFRKMVDAVGGVEMCVPEAIDDPIGKINLPAGTYTMDGDQALGYVRVRHGVGVELGDIGRMKRQQAFLSSLVSKILDAGTLANPIKVLKLVEAGTESLITDPELANLRKLAGLASSFSSIGMGRIRFITAPFQLWEPDPNRVEITDDADLVWDSMKNDKPLPANLREGSVTPKASTPVSIRSAERGEAPSVSSDTKRGLSSSERSAYGLC